MTFRTQEAFKKEIDDRISSYVKNVHINKKIVWKMIDYINQRHVSLKVVNVNIQPSRIVIDVLTGEGKRRHVEVMVEEMGKIFRCPFIMNYHGLVVGKSSMVRRDGKSLGIRVRALTERKEGSNPYGYAYDSEKS